jgi:hypothetical protein
VKVWRLGENASKNKTWTFPTKREHTRAFITRKEETNEEGREEVYYKQ